MAEVIARFKPTRVYVESSRQGFHDSLYNEYRAGRYTLGRNEIYQIGYRVAKAANLPKVYTVDAGSFAGDHYKKYLLIDSMWNSKHSVDMLRDKYWNRAYTRLYATGDSVTKTLTMLENFLLMAAPANLARMHGHYLAGGFNTSTNEGPDVLALWWYSRNLRIFNQILQSRPGPDDRIVVLFGNGHVPVLKHCFESSPDCRCRTEKPVAELSAKAAVALCPKTPLPAQNAFPYISVRKIFGMKRLLFLLAAASLLQNAGAQGFLKKVSQNKVVGSVLQGKPPITTSFKDVDTKNTLPPEFGENRTYQPLSALTKNAEGKYRLTPGFYQTINLSYCLKAGTNGPAKGDSYGNAPILGKMDDVVESILVKSQEMWRNTETNKLKSNAISQKDVQLLLWAIIARASFEDMQNKTKATALALLTPEQIVKLNGGAVKSAVNLATDKGLVDKPVWLRKMEETEQSLRGLYKSSTSTYEDFERLAVLTGLNTEAQPVAFGTWFKHKDGFYIRYEPQGYSRTTVKIYVPEKKEVDLAITGVIATPSDSRQRLAQTDMSVEEYGKLRLL